MSCSNNCATIENYTILLLENSSGNIPSCSWPNTQMEFKGGLQTVYSSTFDTGQNGEWWANRLLRVLVLEYDAKHSIQMSANNLLVCDTWCVAVDRDSLSDISRPETGGGGV